MLEQTKRKWIIETLGPIGNMVADFAHRLQFPINTPPDLAKQFSENESLTTALENFSLSHISTLLPPHFFPMKTLEDLVNRLEKQQIKEVLPHHIVGFLNRQPMIGITLKRDEAILQKEGEIGEIKTGGPDELPPTPFKNPPHLKEINAQRSQIVQSLGNIGNIVADIMEKVAFPVKNKLELAKQFSEEECLVIGATHYPIPKLIYDLPESFFPIKSSKAVLAKLVKLNFQELTPFAMRSMLDASESIGLRLETDEKRLFQQTQHPFMNTGGPDDIPKINRNAPEIPVLLSDRAKMGDVLGPIGDLVYDLGRYMTFPIANPIALATHFKEKDALMIGVRPYALKKLAFKVPEAFFPIASLDDLTQKLAKVGAANVALENIKQLVSQDTDVGYTLNWTEADLKFMTRDAKMKTGGPEDLPSQAKK